MPTPPNNPPNGDPNAGQPPVVDGAAPQPTAFDLAALPPAKMGNAPKADKLNYNPASPAFEKALTTQLTKIAQMRGLKFDPSKAVAKANEMIAQGASYEDVFIRAMAAVGGKDPSTVNRDKLRATFAERFGNAEILDTKGVKVTNNPYGIQGIDDDTVAAAEFLMNNPEPLIRAFEDVENSGDSVGEIGTFLSNTIGDFSDTWAAAMGGEAAPNEARSPDEAPTQVQEAIDTLTYLMKKQAGSVKRLKETDAYAANNKGFAQRELSPDTVTPEERTSADTARTMLADLKAAIRSGDAKKVARIYQMSKAVKEADERKEALQEMQTEAIEAEPLEDVQKSEPSAVLGSVYKDGDYVDVKRFLADMSMATDAYYNNSFQVDTESEDFLDRPITLVDRYVRKTTDSTGRWQRGGELAELKVPAHELPRKTLDEQGAIRRTTIGELMTEAIERARDNPDLAEWTTDAYGQPLTVEEIMARPQALNRLGGLVFDDLADSYVMGQTTKDALTKSKIFYEARSDAEMRNALRRDKKLQDEAADDSHWLTKGKALVKDGVNMTVNSLDGLERMVAYATYKPFGYTNEEIHEINEDRNRLARQQAWVDTEDLEVYNFLNPLAALPKAGELLNRFGEKGKVTVEDIKLNPDHPYSKLLGGAAGSMIPMLVVGAAGGGAVASGLVGGLGMAESNYEEAIGAGADVDTAMLQFGVGMGLGLTEALPLAKAFSRARKVGGVGAGKSFVGRAVEFGGTTLKGSVEEGTQEMLSSVVNNMSAKETYDYTRELVNEGTLDEGFAGVVLGGLMNTLGAKSRYAQNKEARKLYKKAEAELARYAAELDVVPGERSLETALRRRERDVREHYRRKKQDVTDEQVRSEAADLVAKDLTEDIGVATTADQVLKWADAQHNTTQADVIADQVKAEAERAKRENPDLTDEQATAQAKETFAERIVKDSEGELSKEDVLNVLDQAQSIAAQGQAAADAADVATAEEVIGERVLDAQVQPPPTQADAPPVAETFEPTREDVPGAVAPEPAVMPAETVDAGRDIEVADPNVERAPEPPPMTRKQRMQKRIELETRTDELIEMAAQELGVDPARVRKDMKREGLDPKRIDEAQDAAALAQYEMLLEDFVADFAPDASSTTTTGTETAATQETQAATDPTPLAEAATETQPEVAVDSPLEMTPEEQSFISNLERETGPLPQQRVDELIQYKRSQQTVETDRQAPLPVEPTTTEQATPVEPTTAPEPTPTPQPASEATVDTPPASEPESVRNAREQFGWKNSPIQMEDAGRNRVRITSYPAPETGADIGNAIGSIEDILDDTSTFKRKDQPDNLQPIVDAVAASSYTPQTPADLTDLLQTINDVDRIVGKKRRESGVSAQATAIKDALLTKVDDTISTLSPERVAQMSEADLQAYYDFLVDLGDTATTPTQADALTNVERELFGESDSQLEQETDARQETLREQKDGGQKEKPRQKKKKRKKRKKKKLSQQEAVDYHLGRSKPKGSWADKTVALLESAMPNVDITTDPAEFSRVLASVGRTGPAPRGFVYKGKVYLNPKKMRPDTPIHEYGHLWIMQMKNDSKATYDALYKAATQSPLFNEIAARYADTLHTQGEIIEEVMAEAIGRAGADVMSTNRPPKGLTNELLNAIKRAYTWLMGRLGFKGHASEMTLGALAEREAMRLLSGKKISELTSADYAAMMTQRLNEQREASKDTSPEQTSREKLKADPDLKKQVVTVAANAYADLLNAEIDTASQRAEARGEKFNVSTATTRAIQKVTFQQYQAAATEAMAKAKVKGLDNLEVAAALENQYRTVSQAGINQVVKRDLRGATDLKNTLKRFGKEIADANLRYYYQEQLVQSFEQMAKDKNIRGVSTNRLRPFVNALTTVKPTTKGFDQAFGALEKMVNDQQFADRVKAQKATRKKVMRKAPKTEYYGAWRADRELWKKFGALPVGPSVIEVLPDGMDFEGYLKTYEDLADQLLSKTYNKDALGQQLEDLKVKTTDELFAKKQEKKKESALNYLSAPANRKLFEQYHSEIYGYPPAHENYYKPEYIDDATIELAHEVMQIPAREKRAAQRTERQRVARAAAEQRVLELADILDLSNIPVEIGVNNQDQTGVSILQKTLGNLDDLNHREMQMFEQELAFFMNNGNVSNVAVKEFGWKDFRRGRNEIIKEARKNGNSELRQIHLMGTQRAGTAYFNNEKARAKDGGAVEEAEKLYSRFVELMNWDYGLTTIKKGQETRLSLAAQRQNMDQFVSSIEEGFKGIKDTHISVISEMAGDFKSAEKRIQDQTNAVNKRIKDVTRKHRKTLDETSNFKVSALAAVNQAPTRRVGETKADYEKRRAATIKQNAIAMRRGFTKSNLKKQGYTPAQADKIAREMHEFFHKLRTENRDADFKPLPYVRQNPETGKFEERAGGYTETIGGKEVTLYYTTDPELLKQGMSEGEVALYEEMRDILAEQQPDMKATAQMVYGEAFDLQENYFPFSRKSGKEVDDSIADPRVSAETSGFSNFTTEAGALKDRAEKTKDRNDNFFRVDAMRVFNAQQRQTAFSLHAGGVAKQWMNFWSKHNTDLWDAEMVKDMLGPRHIANDAEARDFAKQTSEIMDSYVVGRVAMLKNQDNVLSKGFGEVLAAATKVQYNTVLTATNAVQNSTDFVRVIAEQAASNPESIIPGIRMAADFTGNPNGPYAQHYRVEIADRRDRRLSVKDPKLERALKKAFNKLPTGAQLAGDKVAQVNQALVELGERSVQGVEDMNRSVLFYSALHEYYSTNGLKWSKAELEKGADPNALRFAQNRVDNAFATGTKVGRAATFNVTTRWDGTARSSAGPGPGPEWAAVARMAQYGYRYNMRTQSYNALANLGRFFRTWDFRYLVRCVGNTMATFAWLEAEAIMRGLLNDLVGGEDDDEDGAWNKHKRLGSMAVIENMTSPMGAVSYQLMTAAIETTNELVAGEEYDKFKDGVTMAPSFAHLINGKDPWKKSDATFEAVLRLVFGATYFKGKGVLFEGARVVSGNMRETDGYLLALHVLLGLGIRPYAAGDIEKALKAYQRAQYTKNKKSGGSAPPPTGLEDFSFESLPVEEPVMIEPEYGYGVDDF